MDRVNGLNHIDLGGGRRGFRSRDTVAGLPGTEVTAKFLNDLQEEVCNAIFKVGSALDAASQLQLVRAIRSQRTNWVGQVQRHGQRADLRARSGAGGAGRADRRADPGRTNRPEHRRSDAVGERARERAGDVAGWHRAGEWRARRPVRGDL